MKPFLEVFVERLIQHMFLCAVCETSCNIQPLGGPILW